MSMFISCFLNISVEYMRFLLRRLLLTWTTWLFRGFLTQMGITPTSESVAGADEVVELEKLHRYGYFPDWTTVD